MCFSVFCVKIRPRPLAVASCKNPKKLTRFWCAKSRMRRNDTPGWIVRNVCTHVGVHDVITCADLYDYRLRGLGVAGGQILGFSIDLRCRPYSTVSIAALVMSKAFDKVHHYALFPKLMKRDVPVCLIKLLSDWYGKVFACVKWGACLSKLVQFVTLLMPISCHFRHCKALLVTSLTLVTTSWQ